MNELRSSSPAASDTFSDGMDSLSMRDKSLVKRSISKHHNDNFTAGYVPVHEQYLQKTGLRGRKTFAFWTLVGLLFLLAVGNLTLTMTILGVLRLGQGMQSLELVPENGAIKLFGNTDLKDIYKRDGRLEGFRDYPVDISGYNGSIIVKLDKNGRLIDKFQLNKTGAVIENINSFEIKSKEKSVFNTNSPVFNINSRLKNLNTKNLQSDRLVSPINTKLQLEAKKINLRGAEGTWMESSEMLFSADGDVYLKSLNGSIILTSHTGTFMDLKKLPTYVPKYSELNLQYKICVCMPHGKLFKIPVTKDNSRVFCDHINLSQYNPCAYNKM